MLRLFKVNLSRSVLYLSNTSGLKNAGVKELLVISQDTSAYGVDVKNKTDFWDGMPVKTSMLALCEQLGKLGIWVRLHYVYPYPHLEKNYSING